MIQLTTHLAMTADDYCYIVGKPRQRAAKGFKMDKPKYYSTADKAVTAALDRALRDAVADGSITTLQQFIEEQRRLNEELRRLLAPVAQACQGTAEAHIIPGEGKNTTQEGRPSDG